MKKKRINYFKYFSLFFAIVVLVFIAGCGGTNPTAPIINSFSALPSTITEGESSTLSWSVTDATGVTIDNDVGIVALTGTTAVNPTTTTTYTLTATNVAGSVTATTTVTVSSAVTVTYSGNGSTGGTTPTDSSSPYEYGATVTVLGNTGSLVKTGYTFDGWNTQADGSGTDRAEGSTFTMGASNVTLYAKWTANNYTVTFNKDDDDAIGSMTAQTIACGSSANLTACAFTKAGYTFAGWATSSGGSVAYADEASYTIGTSNVTLYAQWTPLYTLRDIGPAGGRIFYVKADGYSDGWMYMEAAPASTEWTAKKWGSYGTLIRETATAIGTGQRNTNIIVEWLNSNIDNTNGDVANKADRAAYLCDDLVVGSGWYFLPNFNDWFLPSKDELNLMYQNLKVTGVGGFADNYYWSSSENDGNLAWYQYFGDGGQGSHAKYSAFRVRAVRAF